MTDFKESQGLEVVGYLLAKGRALSIWPANKDTDEPLCRLSDATAVIDQLREQLEWVKAINGALDESNKRCLEELSALKSAPVVMPERKELSIYADEEFHRWLEQLPDEAARLNRSKT